MSINLENSTNQQNNKQLVKCVVWDLDNTLWNGVLLEDNQISLCHNVVHIINILDSRGILQSIASKNESTIAIAKLKEFGLCEYFLYPQINWNSKIESIKNIARLLNIGLDAIAFIDDQQFELEEMKFSLPEVLCLDAANLQWLLDMPEINPRLITEDGKNRRLRYISDLERKISEESYVGTEQEFLATLNMRFTIASAKKEDLRRAEELTLRTNQLNTTGYTYSYEELNDFIKSEEHKLLIACLDDKYGSYGQIGLALVECQENLWTIKLLLMSCRVMSRGVGTVMLNYIMQMAKHKKVCLLAEFVSNNRNRMMYITYKFLGFTEIHKIGNTVILENDLSRIQSLPEYINIQVYD